MTLPVGLALLTLLGYGLSAQAQSEPNRAAEPVSNPVEASVKTLETDSDLILPSTPMQSLDLADAQQVTTPRAIAMTPDSVSPTVQFSTSQVAEPQPLQPSSKAERSGEGSRSAAVLTKEPAKDPSSGVAQIEPEPEPVLTPVETYPTRTSFIGVGGNIGITGNSSDISRGGFTILSKIAMTRDISVRPGVVFNEDVAVTVPVTYDIGNLQESIGFPIAPYIGGGVAFSTGNNSQVGPLLSGGIDVPITSTLTATAGVNSAFFDTTDLGVFLGVGYNFATGF